MAIRIEHIVFTATLLVVFVALSLVIKEQKKPQNSFTKELIFTNTTFTEVDTNTSRSQAYTTYGVRDNAILTAKNLTYQTEKIDSLVANDGKLDGDMVYLNGNVVLHANDGYVYKTQAANYNEKTEILTITAPFVATQGGNVVEGDSLRYHVPTKESNATEIDATLYTIEK